MSKVYLILGGNGFIGAEVVSHLLLTSPSQTTELVLLNRGNWADWDTKSRIRPFTTNIPWDRKTDSIAAALAAYLQNAQFTFEAVIDFSAYKRRDVRNVLKELGHSRFKVYILISSDSVYEVAAERKGDPCRQFVEADSVRPDSTKERERLNSADSYGHHKLECEEYLLDKAAKTGFCYVVLRISDVIGPRDSTERFWFYQMWLEYLSSLDVAARPELIVHIPDQYFETRTSYTYVADIAKCVRLLLDKAVRNEVFNVSCSGAGASLVEFHRALAAALRPGLEERLRFARGGGDVHVLPSVARAGGTSSERLFEVTGFRGVSLRVAVEETVGFYAAAYREFPGEARRVARAVKKAFLKGSGAEELRRFEEFLASRMN